MLAANELACCFLQHLLITKPFQSKPKTLGYSPGFLSRPVTPLADKSKWELVINNK